MRILTDSTCDLSLRRLDELGVEMLSLGVHFGDAQYFDKRTLTNDEFYRRLAASAQLPTTSALSIGDFAEAFALRPEEDVLVLLISSTLSTTYQSAVIAREDAGRDNIYLVDTKVAAVALGLLVELACRMRDEGLSAAEIAQRLAALSGRLRLFGTVDTLEYLIKGGRLPKTVGLLANALGIRPILTLEDGSLVKKETVRGKHAPVGRLIELALKEGQIDPSLPVGLAGYGNSPQLDQLKEAFLAFPDCVVTEIGSVIGTHLGPGGLIVAFFAL